MKRRKFFSYGAAAGISGALAGSCGRYDDISAVHSPPIDSVPSLIASMTLEQLWEDHRERLFDRFLPFWEIGGIDREYGGYLCFLHDDGSVANHDKFTRHQGRGLWVYSYLYNNFGNDPKHLENAAITRDFMVEHMYTNSGLWVERTSRDGEVKQGVSENIISGLVAASGLIEFNRATGNPDDVRIATDTIWRAIRAYDNPAYQGESYSGIVHDPEITSGIRSLGQTIPFITVLNQFLSYRSNRRLQDLIGEQINNVMNRFWASHMRIMNEYLQHDFVSIAGISDHMYVGNAIEALFLVMTEAIRRRHRMLFNQAKERFRIILEMSWDYNFEGIGSQHFFVFDGPHRTRNNLYGLKTMKAHADALAGLMKIIEYTGENWAVEWYDRVLMYSSRAFDTPYGVWRQAVDRTGKEPDRSDVLPILKDNYYQARCLMLNLQSIENMIDYGTLSRI